jgi:FkbM family methyltransferase
MRAPDAFILLLRAYIRWTPWRFGGRTLWARAAEPLARRPRAFVARSAYGFGIAGDQRLIMPRRIYWFGRWEPPLSEWIRRGLRPGDVFVDAGANLGYFTLLAARAVAPRGWVVAVEASAITAGRRKESLAHNRVRNVRVVHATAAADEGAVPFYRARRDQAEDSTVQGKGKELVGEVRALPLHALLTEPELRRERVIKVDVGGGELGVLRGLRPAPAALRPDAEIAVERLTRASWRHRACLCATWSTSSARPALGRANCPGRHPHSGTFPGASGSSAAPAGRRRPAARDLLAAECRWPLDP